jgi:hypothetical protein
MSMNEAVDRKRKVDEVTEGEVPDASAEKRRKEGEQEERSFIFFFLLFCPLVHCRSIFCRLSTLPLCEILCW